MSLYYNRRNINSYVSALIQPINLPSGSELNDNFVGRTALLSGYGVTRQCKNL